MRSLHISGEKLLLGFDFLAYITKFLPDWQSSAPKDSKSETLWRNPVFEGWLPPDKTTSGFTTDPLRLRDVLYRSVEIPQKFDEKHVDLYGLDEYFEPCLSSHTHAFLRGNRAALQHVTIDAYPLLLITSGSGMDHDSEARDSRTHKLENAPLAYICRFLHAMAVGKVQESNLR